MAKEETPAIEPLDPDIRDKMKDSGREALLELLAGLLTRDLLVRIAQGVATPSDRNVARQLLRDAGIELSPKSKDVTNLNDVLKQAGVDTDDSEDSESVYPFSKRA